jgi:hypothetical protein
MTVCITISGTISETISRTISETIGGTIGMTISMAICVFRSRQARNKPCEVQVHIFHRMGLVRTSQYVSLSLLFR